MLSVFILLFFIIRVQYYFFFFFFSSRRRHTRLQGDWSSDVCSSDLARRRHRYGNVGRPASFPPRVTQDPPSRRRSDSIRQARDVARQAWAEPRSEEHTSELQSPCNLVCRLLLEKKKNIQSHTQLRPQ